MKAIFFFLSLSVGTALSDPCGPSMAGKSRGSFPQSVKVRTLKLRPETENSSIRASIKVLFDEALVVGQISLIQPRDKRILFMPSKLSSSHMPEEVVSLLNAPTRQAVESAVYPKFNEMLSSKETEYRSELIPINQPIVSISKVNVSLVDNNESGILARVSLTFNGYLKIRGIEIVKKPSGIILQFPCFELVNGLTVRVVHPVNETVRTQFETVILPKFFEAIKKKR